MEGARFCHKCGRPLREEPVIVPEPAPVVGPEPIVQAQASAPPPEISFKNGVAVRVGFLVAGLGIFVNNLTALLQSTPLQVLMFIGLSVASGGFAVWLYKRRTGVPVSIRGGARLGWITGVLSFVIVTVITTLSIALIGPDKLMEVYRNPMVGQNIPSAEIERLLENPAAIVMALILTLAALFMTYTVASSVGGAVGAKLLNKDGPTV